MLTRSSATLNHWNERSKHWVSLWTITRKDGVILRFTSHDHVLEDASGNEYTPAGGFDGSARQRIDAFKDHTVDFRGVIDSEFITVADLRSGLYREAKVREDTVDSRWPWLGTIMSETWWVDQTTFEKFGWMAEMSGPSRFLKRKIGHVLDRTCERKLYDTLCTVSRALFTVSATVVGTEDGEKKLVIYADPAMAAQSDDYYAYGDVTFTSGANDGLRENVKAYRSSDRRIELQGPMPFPIAPGDTFDIAAGCDKLRATCINKFGNINNGAMWSFIPGSDRVLQTPRR